MYASYSADGEHFTEAGQVLPFITDNPPIVHWDGRIGKYVIYTRALAYDSENQRRIARIETDDPLKPWPHRKSSNDRMFFATGNADVVLQADAEDDPHSDFYYNASSLYPWAQDVYLMFPVNFRHFSPQRNPYVKPRPGGQWEDFGMLETQLAISRDGVNWSRPDREPYVATGLPDEWDRWYAVMGPGIVRQGSYLYQYYYSSGRLHDSAILRPEYETTAKQLGGVGVVRQRLDGFISARRRPSRRLAHDTRPHLPGHPAPPEHRHRSDGHGLSSACSTTRESQLPGFTVDDCEEIGGNFVDQAVSWKGNPDVSTLSGRPVRIQIKLKRAKLYAFQFTHD